MHLPSSAPLHGHRLTLGFATRLIAACACLVSLGGQIHAQTSITPGTAVRAGEPVTLNFVGAEIEAVVTEANVTDFVLGKAKVSDKQVSFQELMDQPV